jgi:hypothetical protein
MNELIIVYIVAAFLSFIDISMTFYLFNLTDKYKQQLKISETNVLINTIRKYLSKPWDYICSLILIQFGCFWIYYLNDVRWFYFLIGLLVSVIIVHFASVKLVKETIKQIEVKKE